MRIQRLGFTLLEVLLAVGLMAVIAVAALHARAVMIRAEQRVRRMDSARLQLRNVKALSRAAAPPAAWENVIAEDWQLSVETVTAPVVLPVGTNLLVPWSIWRLADRDGQTELEMALETPVPAETEHE